MARKNRDDDLALNADDAVGGDSPLSVTPSGELSPTMRNYLAEIHRLIDRAGDARGYVGTSALADLLNVSAPAVNRMVSKLRDLGLLEHEPYQGIRLTDAGAREALKHLRRHRIAEAFLMSVMNFGWHEVYDEAREIARALSDTIAARMLDMAGNPSVCPHGEPIPSLDGDIAPFDDALLIHAPLNTPLTITRVLTREADRLEYLAALELTPGAQVQVTSIAPFNGPVQLHLRNKEFRIIGHNLAEMIRARVDE